MTELNYANKDASPKKGDVVCYVYKHTAGVAVLSEPCIVRRDAVIGSTVELRSTNVRIKVPYFLWPNQLYYLSDKRIG